MTFKRIPPGSPAEPIPTAEAAAANALVFTADDGALQVLQAVAGPFAICLHATRDPVEAFDLLNKRKFEAIIVDLDAGQDALTLVGAIQFSHANKTAVTFALTPANGSVWRSTATNATFVFERPLDHERVFNTIRAAYGLLIRERRRYFRCPIGVNAAAQTAKIARVSCRIRNISEGGAAVSSYVLLGEDPLSLDFELPRCPGKFFAHTRVCWRKSQGEVGLEFISFPRKAELQSWLAQRLEERLPESVSRLFKAV